MCRADTPSTSDASHPGQLDIGAFQHLLQPVDLGSPFPRQGGSVSDQLPQLALRSVRDHATAQQPVPQQVGNPRAVPHVRLAARHGLDVPRVDQQQHEPLLQQVPDGLPVGG
jgi:hypothetical protein